jgi:hypothetical protein
VANILEVNRKNRKRERERETGGLPLLSFFFFSLFFGGFFLVIFHFEIFLKTEIKEAKI